MDPNFPMNMNSNMDYLYDDNLSLNYPQASTQHQFQYQPPVSAQPFLQQHQEPQHQSVPDFQHQFQYQAHARPSQPSQHPQPQPYTQPRPQNYPQYYQNQNQNQSFQPDFQPDYTQFQQPFYQQPPSNLPLDQRHLQQHAQYTQQPVIQRPQPVPKPVPQPVPQPIQRQFQPQPPPLSQLHLPPPPAPKQRPPSQSPIQSNFEIVIPPQKHRSPSGQSHQPNQSHQNPNFETVIPSHKNRSPSIQSHQSHQQTTHSRSAAHHEAQAQKKSPSSKPPRRPEPQYSPLVKQEHPSQPHTMNNQQLPTTVSLEQIQMKPPKPPPPVIPHQMQTSPPQGKPRILQTVEVITKPKQPTTKPAELQDIPAKAEFPEPEYPTLLCALADDYLAIARKLPEVTDEYQELVALALGCLESALANLKLQPLREAQASLRYAQVLYEETENYDEAETQLTKAIELCERHKFVDLKYEMQLLLSKVLYQSKPKAALRDIQRMIDDIQAYRHTAWQYLFRFQHVMFSLASSSFGDVHSSTTQLEKISNLARQNSDSAILAFAAVIEALLHLSSSNQDAITATQNALAKARALQLNPDVEAIPQMTIVMEFIDLVSSVQECNIVQTEQKRKILHDVLYDAIGNANWREDGLIHLPISKRSLAGVHVSTNGHIFEKNGKYFMGFLWLVKEEAEALGFLFSADSAAHKNGHDGKAEKYAKNGLALVRGWQQPVLSENYEQSDRSLIGHKLLEAQFLFLIAFMLSAKGRWEKANKAIAEISQVAGSLGDNFPTSMMSGMLYLRGIILQGLGDTTAALAVYQSGPLALAPQQNAATPEIKVHHRISRAYYPDSDATRNFRVLAAMNAAFIIQNPQHPQHHQLSSLLSSIRPIAEGSANKHIKAHYSLMVSILSTTTLTVKQYLKSAMDAGKATGSAMTTALALIYMQQKMFRGTVDEQAIKCARAATHQARRWGDPMWTHVAAGLEAESLEINGLTEEAMKKKVEADSLWDGLPELVKNVQSR